MRTVLAATKALTPGSTTIESRLLDSFTRTLTVTCASGHTKTVHAPADVHLNNLSVCQQCQTANFATVIVL